MATCQYCGKGMKTCNEYKTIPIMVPGAEVRTRYEIYYCTRPKGHSGGHVACWDDPKLGHQRKAWAL